MCIRDRNVTDVHEHDGILWHSVDALPESAVPGTAVSGCIDWEWRFDAVCETFTLEIGGGQIWHHGAHAGVRSDIRVSSDAGLKPFSRGVKGGAHGHFADLSRFRR